MAGWLVGKSDFNENPVVCLGLESGRTIQVSSFQSEFGDQNLANIGTQQVAGWLENLILMKTQSSAQTWTWTLDFDLGFVN